MTNVTSSTLNRWWIYQKERFPVFSNGLLIAIFSASAVGYSLLIRAATERSLPQVLGLILLAFLASFLLFLQLRIADEFKDLKEDVLYRSHYPVPRGLVTLQELKLIGFASGLIQLGLALSLGLPMVLLLVLIWGYFGLITKEFFVPSWLKAHPLIHMLSHVAIIPLLALYATAHDWLTAGVLPSRALIWFLLISLLSGLTIELGRKIRAPKAEETGLKTYSAILGYRPAVITWLFIVWLLTLVALQASVQTGFVVPATVITLILLISSVIMGWRFWTHPTLTAAKRIELVSGLWSIGIYFNVGILPLLLRQ